MPYFVTLIGQFDAAVGAAEPLEYHLRYISAGEVLPVLQDLLAEDQTQATRAKARARNRISSNNRIEPLTWVAANAGLQCGEQLSRLGRSRTGFASGTE